MTKITIFDYQSSNDKQNWCEKIKQSDWGAAKLLVDLLERDKFHEVLGNGKLLIMADGDNLVSFCTLTDKDCINDDNLFPWIGFVFTTPEYRGNRYSGELIEFACSEAKKQGCNKVYIATDHTGLYEKYGFTYLENRIDIYDEESRIYIREI